MEEIKNLWSNLKRGDKEAWQDTAFAVVIFMEVLGVVYVAAMLQNIFFP